MRPRRTLTAAALALAASTGVAVASTAIGGPADDPDRPTGTVSLQAEPVAERAGRARIVVRREPGAVARIAWETRAGTAAAGRDFTPARGVVQFRPGQHEKVVEVAVRADGEAEGAETFDVRAGALPGHATPPPIASATVVIGE